MERHGCSDSKNFAGAVLHKHRIRPYRPGLDHTGRGSCFRRNCHNHLLGHEGVRRPCHDSGEICRVQDQRVSRLAGKVDLRNCRRKDDDDS